MRGGIPSGMQHPRLFACSRAVGVTFIWPLLGATEADTDLGPKNIERTAGNVKRWKALVSSANGHKRITAQ